MGTVSVANPASSTMKQLDHLDRDEAGCGLFSFFCLRLFTQPQPAGQYMSDSTQAPIDYCRCNFASCEYQSGCIYVIQYHVFLPSIAGSSKLLFPQ